MSIYQSITEASLTLNEDDKIKFISYVVLLFGSITLFIAVFSCATYGRKTIRDFNLSPEKSNAQIEQEDVKKGGQTAPCTPARLFDEVRYKESYFEVSGELLVGTLRSRYIYTISLHLVDKEIVRNYSTNVDQSPTNITIINKYIRYSELLCALCEGSAATLLLSFLQVVPKDSGFNKLSIGERRVAELQLWLNKLTIEEKKIFIHALGFLQKEKLTPSIA